MASQKSAIPRKPRAIKRVEDLDENMLAKLPEGSKVISVAEAGISWFMCTNRIDVQLADGTTTSFFMKHGELAQARDILAGTWQGEILAHSFVPHLVPKPIGWGVFASAPNSYFYIAEYISFQQQATNPQQWAKALSTLHNATRGKSPGGKFGFGAPTYMAWIPADNTWEDTWEKTWTRKIRALFEEELKLNGPDDELAKLKEVFFSNVVPRLLRPLETGGRKIEPVLLHGDTWLGNIKVRGGTDEACMFDFCASWGHNEADLFTTYNPRYGLQDAADPYNKLQPKSEPAEDFHGRVQLYAIKSAALLSTMYGGGKFRDMMRYELGLLVEKYGKDEVPKTVMPTLESAEKDGLEAAFTQNFDAHDRNSNVEGSGNEPTSEGKFALEQPVGTVSSLFSWVRGALVGRPGENSVL